MKTISGLMSVIAAVLSLLFVIDVQAGVNPNLWKRDMSSIPADQLLVVRGENLTEEPILLVVRIDDHNSTDYFSRFNVERKIAPGRFELSFATDQLLRSNSRKEALNLNNLKAMYIFEANEKAFRIDSVTTQQRKTTPKHIIAYDLGSEPLDGTIGISAKNSGALQLIGMIRTVNRPGSDPWIRDGIAGIDKLRLPLDSGIWRVHLFREDIGEWENLPRQQNLDVRVKDKIFQSPVKMERPQSWYHNRYLSFYSHEALIDPWEDIVRHRGLVQTFDLLHDGAVLELEFLGSSPQERFLSGLLLEKLDQDSTVNETKTSAKDWLENQRKKYFKQHWFVEQSEEHFPGINFGDSHSIIMAENEKNRVTIRFAVAEKQQAKLDLKVPQGFKVESHYSVSRWYREGSSNTLFKSRRHLKALNTDHVFEGGAHEVILGIEVDPDENNASVRHLPATLAVFLNPVLLTPERDNRVRSVVGDRQRRKMNIQLMNTGIQLRNDVANVGIYLDDAPHLTWFPEWQNYPIAQTYCDLRYLSSTGLKALAPPLVTPTKDKLEQWQTQLKLYEKFYPHETLLAYTPFKRLKSYIDGPSLEKYLEWLYATQPESKRISWSLADEASADSFAHIRQDSRRLHSANQNAKTAGQLNNPEQDILTNDLDLVLINHGFGINEEVFSRYSDKEVWLYNMPRFRMAAGFYLWRTGAQGYVQWHGRMPTANPYDPTDGREADYQFFPPSHEACSLQPDIDRRLFDLAQGRNDGRWLHWLQGQGSPEARLLSKKIREAVSEDWSKASTITELQLDQWMIQIKKLAWSLKHPDEQYNQVLQKAKTASGEMYVSTGDIQQASEGNN